MRSITSEKANQVKSQFLATMSHEIRTPIGTILGCQELLDDTVLDVTQKSYLQMANEAGNTLLNLVSNAVKFTPSGSITVKLTPRPTEAKDGILFLEVIDTGIGIAEEVQPSLFSMFTQADDADTREYGGSGLGLAISKQRVELWGGHIGLESQIGIGSRFWFTFGNRTDSEQGLLTQDKSMPDRYTCSMNTRAPG